MIPTAEEFLHNKGFDMLFDGDKITSKMIEFAKLHVKAALEAAANQTLPTEYHKKLILTSYPLEKIK